MLVADGTTNRVGVGTATPAVPLDVVGAAAFSSTVGVTGITTATGGLVIGTGTVRTTQQLRGSKTHDWGNLAAGAAAQTTVTVTGAAVGDGVRWVSMSTVTTDDLGLFGQATSANTVTVVLRNFNSGSGFDLASGTLIVIVEKVSAS